MDVRKILDDSWRTEGRVPPPLLLAGGLLAQSLLSRKGSGFFSRAAGLVLGAGSVALAGAGAAGLAKHGTTLNPVVPDAKVLVTDGANALTRNPMYTGLVGLLVARAVSRRSLAALAPAAAVAYLLDSRQVPAEEAVLAERFGPRWEEYRDAAPRWVDSRTLQGLRGLVPQLEQLPWFQGEPTRTVVDRDEPPRSYPEA